MLHKTHHSYHMFCPLHMGLDILHTRSDTLYVGIYYYEVGKIQRGYDQAKGSGIQQKGYGWVIQLKGGYSQATNLGLGLKMVGQGERKLKEWFGPCEMG